LIKTVRLGLVIFTVQPMTCSGSIKPAMFSRVHHSGKQIHATSHTYRFNLSGRSLRIHVNEQ
jgi:hypothetical protein